MSVSVLCSTPSSCDGVERIFAFPEGGARHWARQCSSAARERARAAGRALARAERQRTGLQRGRGTVRVPAGGTARRRGAVARSELWRPVGRRGVLTPFGGDARSRVRSVQDEQGAPDGSGVRKTRWSCVAPEHAARLVSVEVTQQANKAAEEAVALWDERLAAFVEKARASARSRRCSRRRSGRGGRGACAARRARAGRGAERQDAPSIRRSARSRRATRMRPAGEPRG